MSIFNSEHRGFIAGVLTVVYLGTAGTAVAQIVPDATPPNNTVVTPSGNSFTIEGGTTAGSNLFDSFTEFGVPTGSEAFFNNATTIDNIITRVTGGKISNIDGLMRANGSANLFLINPHGIVFGPNARLDIGGSFFGSTAESILFENGLEFSATDPQTPPLLTINVPLGLQYGSHVRPIVNRSVVGLEVKPGNTLALIGGNISLEGGDMRAASGRIELSSVGDNQRVNIMSTDNGFRLGYDGVNNFQDVELSGGATVDVSGVPGGEVNVQARTFRLREDAKITSINLGSQAGGIIQINATELVELIGTGNPVAEIVEIIDNGIANNSNLPSGLFSASVGTGSGGNIRIDTDQLIATDSSFIYAIASREGRGGSLTINASESVQLTSLSFLGTNTISKSTGDGGNIRIDTGRLLLEEGAIISATTEGTGRGGNLTVNASESIDIFGTNTRVAERSDGRPLIFNTALFTAAILGSSGDAGEMRVSTERLRVSNGASLVINSQGEGRPGNLFLTATSSAEFIGTAPGELAFPSAIQAIAGRSTTGTGGGNVIVTTENLILRNEGAIVVNNLSVGSGGRVEIVANSIWLDNEANITAETAFGQGGNIVLRTRDLRLRDNSEITTTAGSAFNLIDFPPDLAAVLAPLITGVGDGGNITISTDTLVALENSDITANAQDGFGGRVLITTRGIFTSSDSDITATSARGASFSGVVEIEIQDVDRARGIIKLPESPLDVSHLLGKDFCSVAAAANSSFVITGRGGIPRNPGDMLPGMTTRVNLVDPVFGEEIRSLREPVTPESTRSLAESNARSPRIVEAQGWYVNSEGVVVLTANPTIINPQTSGLVHPQCHLPGER